MHVLRYYPYKYKKKKYNSEVVTRWMTKEELKIYLHSEDCNLKTFTMSLVDVLREEDSTKSHNENEITIEFVLDIVKQDCNRIVCERAREIAIKHKTQFKYNVSYVALDDNEEVYIKFIEKNKLTKSYKKIKNIKYDKGE